MTDDRIIASPMLDRERVANAIQRGVRLQLDPARAKFAIADAVVDVFDEHGPDDLDRYIRERAAASPEFAAEFVKAEHAAQIRALQDLLGCVWLYISWPHVTRQLTTEQKELFADSVDASCERIAEMDGRIGAPGHADRWWRQR